MATKKPTPEKQKEKAVDKAKLPVRFDGETNRHLQEMVQGTRISQTALINIAVDYYYKNHYLPNKPVMDSKAKPKKA